MLNRVSCSIPQASFKRLGPIRSRSAILPRQVRLQSSCSGQFRVIRIITLRSFSGTNLAIAASIALVGAAAFEIQAVSSFDNKEQSLEVDENAVMAAGEPLPGRPGNLTPEQLEKLKELWVALFRVFGVKDVQGPERPVSQKTAEEKKKKGGLFGGKADADPEDKYGQNKEFQKTIETHSPEELRQAFWDMAKMDNPDALLLRFLRARKWNVQNGLVMLIATIQWRLNEVKVDSDVMKRGEEGALIDSESSDAQVKKEGHDFLRQIRLGKSHFHGTDKEGRPICFVPVRLHRAGDQTEKSQERFTVYTIETARFLLHDNIDTAAILFDMREFSLANMDYVPVKFMIKCFEANYPESLGVVLVHQSPWIFQSIWRIIKGWLDPVVAAKVHFTKNIEELSHFIPLDHIPQDMGGHEPYKYSYVQPVKGENKSLEETTLKDELQKRRAEVVKEYEEVTKKWLLGEKEAEASRKELTERLRTGYWELDPHVRSRTLYDRIGVIGPAGKLDFYPKAHVQAENDNGVDDDVD